MSVLDFIAVPRTEISSQSTSNTSSHKIQSNIHLDKHDLKLLFGSQWEDCKTVVRKTKFISKETPDKTQWIWIFYLKRFYFTIEFNVLGITLEIHKKQAKIKKLFQKLFPIDEINAPKYNYIFNIEFTLAYILKTLNQMKLKWNRKNYDDVNLNSKQFAIELGKLLNLELPFSSQLVEKNDKKMKTSKKRCIKFNDDA